MSLYLSHQDDKQQRQNEMNTTQKRAAKGGEFGANGEFYTGGKFINTVEENSKSLKVAKKATRKQEVAPYVWEVQPEGKISIFSRISGVFATFKNGVAVMSCNDVTVGYYGLTRKTIQNWVDLYNSGERWIDNA